MEISRRTFVQNVGGLTGLGLLGCSTSPFEPTDTPGRLGQASRPQRIVVVGAGMSGLVAAYELMRSGHEVSVLEARERVGGRVLTLREPFASGHLAEAGAARIRPEHDLTLGYANHFGLELDRFYPETEFFVQVTGGRRETLSPRDFLSQWPDFVKIRGGTDRLPTAFADALERRVTTSSPVTEIVVGNGVRVVSRTGRSHDADRVLVTTPVPLLSSIRFSPPLSAAKREAANGGFRYQSATRVYARFRDRFWEAEGLNGWGVTDWPEELWHPTWDTSGPEGVLMTYVRGARADELDELSVEGRLERVLDHWEAFLPGAVESAISGTSHSWQRDPWSRAAWASPTAQQDQQLTAELARPEGPLHFAGEHISSNRGWINGALESGLRAAEEINRA